MLDELKKLAKHATIYGVGNVLNKMVGFFMIPIYTHFLSTADYGTLELLDLCLTLMGLVLTMWMNASIIRHYYDYEDKKDRDQVISTILLLSFGIGVVVAAGGIYCARPLSALILKTPDLHFFVTLISLSFLTSCLITVCRSYLRARQRSTFVVVTDIVNLVITLSLNIYLIAFRRIGVVGVLYSSLIATTLIAAVLTVYILQDVGISFSFDKMKSTIIFGAPLVLTSIATFTINFSDRFFLRHFSTISEVGIYALGYKFGFMLSFLVVQPFDMIWAARMYEIHKRSDEQEVFAKVFEYYSLLLVTVALGLSIVIKEVVAVIAAPSFSAAYKVVPIVALAYIFQGMNRYVVTGAYIGKRTLHLGTIGGISAVINMVLNFFLIGRFGMMGAAWATAFSFFLLAGLTYVASQKVYPITYNFSRVAMPLAVAVALYLLSTLIVTPSLLLSVTLKFAIFLLFPLVLYVLGFFERRELNKMRALVDLLLARSGLRAVAAARR